MFTQGTWRARATQAEYGETNDGNPQIAITFRLLDGPDAGKHIAYYGYFTDKTSEQTFEAMRNAGWTGNDLNDVSSIGRPDGPDCSIVIKNEEDNRSGGIRSRVRFVNRGQGPALKNKMSPEARERFARRMQGALEAFNRKSAQAQSQARPPRAAPQHEAAKGDDIPF